MPVISDKYDFFKSESKWKMNAFNLPNFPDNYMVIRKENLLRENTFLGIKEKW